MAKTKLGSFVDKKKTKLGFGSSNNSSSLVKLQIGKSYSVFLNPNQISHSIKVNFTHQNSLTLRNSIKKIIPISTKPESLNFTLTLDGTGATGVITNVAEEISNLMAVSYHPIVKPEEKRSEIEIKWGNAINFKGYFESAEIIYTLFKPNGEPLRATAALSFIGESMFAKVERTLNGTTVKEVKVDAAKTIVNLCKTIYNTPAVYVAVAKANKLVTIRKLKSDTKLRFPPFKKI